MPASDVLIAFFTAAAIFAFIPGPGILYAAAQTMAGGRAVGFAGTLGLALAHLSQLDTRISGKSLI